VRRAWRYEELSQLSDQELNEESDAIVESIRPLLAHKHPAVQGIVLAELLAIWLTGHAPEISEKLLASHVRGVRTLLPLYRERAQGESEPS
jgi:hypothetical protein